MAKSTKTIPNRHATNGSSSDGTRVQQWQAYTGDVNQQWRFIPLN